MDALIAARMATPPTADAPPVASTVPLAAEVSSYKAAEAMRKALERHANSEEVLQRQAEEEAAAAKLAAKEAAEAAAAKERGESAKGKAQRFSVGKKGSKLTSQDNDKRPSFTLRRLYLRRPRPTSRKEFIELGWRQDKNRPDAWKPPPQAWYRWRLLRSFVSAMAIAEYWGHLGRKLRAQLNLGALKSGMKAGMLGRGWLKAVRSTKPDKEPEPPPDAEPELDLAPPSPHKECPPPHPWTVEQWREYIRQSELRGGPPADTCLCDGPVLARGELRRLRLLAQEEQMNSMREAGWDTNTLKQVPTRFKGLKPWSAEPWSRDAHEFAKRSPGDLEQVYNPDAYGRVGVGRERSPRCPTAPLTSSPLGAPFNQKDYDVKVAAPRRRSRARKPLQPEWNSSPKRHTPHSLKGMRLLPHDKQPWSADEEAYNRNTTRETSRDSWASAEDRAGALGHKQRAAAARLDRPSFWRPNWQQWADSLSA